MERIKMPDKSLRPATVKEVDASNIQEAYPWKSARVADGDYKLVIKEVFDTETNDGDDMWVFTLALKQQPRYTYPYRCPLTPNALGFLAALYRALGVEIKGSVKKRDPNKLLNREIGGSLIEDDYQAEKGRDASKVDVVFPAADVENEPRIGSTPVPASKPAQPRSQRPAGRAQSTAEPAAEDENLDELDLDELDL
jgi:hypothetical protein